MRYWRWAVMATAILLAETPRAAHGAAREDVGANCRVRLNVVSPLEFANTPMDPAIDFGQLIRAAGLSGVLDPNSIRVLDANDGSPVDHARTDDFAYGDKGRVEWVIRDPTHTQYEIQFSVVPKRPPLVPQTYVPMIGVGDLLRYNTGRPEPITAYNAVGLADLTGSGRKDLMGCWNYAYRPGDPWDGIICYPRVGPSDRFEFGDLARLRYVERRGASELKHFVPENVHYMACDFADFNHDGLVDLVLTKRESNVAQFFLNTGKRDGGGLPVFVPSGSVQMSGWDACRAVDLNGDGAIDLVVNGEYVRNLNRAGWPFRPDEPVKLDAGREPCFVDLDRDGRPDAVCLGRFDATKARMAGEEGGKPDPEAVRVAWRRNLGGNPPKFAPEQPLPGVDLTGCTLVAAAKDAGKTLLIVQHDFFQQLSIFELVSGRGEPPRFERRGRAESKSAVLCSAIRRRPAYAIGTATASPTY